MVRILTDNKGFTLIELMITVVLMTALLAFSLPQFLNFNQRGVLVGDSSSFVEALKRTQSMAENGIQDDSGTKIVHYRFELKNQIGSTGNYQSFEIVRIYESASPAALKAYKFNSSSVCVKEMSLNEPIINFGVPSGAVSRGSSFVPILNNTITYRVCNDGYGYQDIEILQGGRIQVNDIVNSASACTCN